jgi:hypothetical protein
MSSAGVVHVAVAAAVVRREATRIISSVRIADRR